MVDSVAATNAARIAALEALALKDNTILPGEVYGGQLHLQPLADDPPRT
jgi:hypothetical protein